MFKFSAIIYNLKEVDRRTIISDWQQQISKTCLISKIIIIIFIIFF